MNKLIRRLDPRRRKYLKQLREQERRQAKALRFEHNLAIQHYIRDQESEFTRCFDRLDTSGDCPVELERTRFLPQILSANYAFYNENYDQAARDYAGVIARIEEEYQYIKDGQTLVQERGKGDFLSKLLALLYNNRARALAKMKQDPASVVAMFEQSIEHEPNIEMLKESLGDYFIGEAKWQEAEGAFRDLYECEPDEEGNKRLAANLAMLRIQQAEELEQKGEWWRALEILESSLKQINRQPLSGWTGKTYLTQARIHKNRGAETDAVRAYQNSVAYYQQAEDPLSAAYVNEYLAAYGAEQGKLSLALEALNHSLTLLESLNDGQAEFAARLWSQKAMAYLLEGRYDDAVTALDTGAEQWRQAGWVLSFDKAIESMLNFAPSQEACLQLRLILDAKLARSTDPTHTSALIYAMRRIWNDPDNRLLPSERPNNAAQRAPMLPVVTPISIEFDGQLLADTGGEGQIVDVLAPAMRKRIETRYGVTVPGVRFRANDTELAQGTYIIMINEVPLRSGVLDTRLRLYPGKSEKLIQANIPVAEEILFDGQPACWVHDEHWESATNAGIMLWEVLEFAIRDLEILLAGKLAEFVGLQETQALLEHNKLVVDFHQDILNKETIDHLGPLNRVLKSLVSERVPITQMPLIYDTFAACSANRMSTWQIIREIRLLPAFSSLLWGNDKHFSHILLGQGVMQVIRDGVSDADGQVLALLPETVQQLLNCIRETVTSVSHPTIVVPGTGYRALVRSLLEIEFPGMPVLAIEELDPTLISEMELEVDMAIPSEDTDEF